MELTREDLKELPVTQSIVKQIGSTHFGLGNRVAFLKVCDVANMGVMQVGVSGIGKTKSLVAVKNMPFRKVFTRKFTLAGIKPAFNKYFSNSEVTWINFELADMSEFVIENMFKVVCDVLTDRSCQVSTSLYDCNIQNATISWLGACTYEIYNRLWKIPAWRGNFKDRILRYFVFAYKRKRVNPNDPHASVHFNLPAMHKVKITTSLFDEVVETLEYQFTSERAFEYAERLLKGSARLNHRVEATDADAKFILLQKPCFEAEGWVGKRKEIAGPVQIDVGALKLFSEALKRGGVQIKKFVRLCRLESQGPIIDCLFKYPHLFKRISDWIFPNPKLVAEQIVPQIEFERMCLNV